jgi:4-diphosphocytidyl-2-C-methyl-D-erythritol kinase
VLIFPDCKINLGLHVLNKRNDGFHNLETVFYPVPLYDGLEMVRLPDAAGKDLIFSISGNSLEVPADDNICSKAFRLLKRDFDQVTGIKMHLHKQIPGGAGLGGGSADGAYTLLLMNKIFNLGLSNEKLLAYALELGSDCPFFIVNKPAFATGRGEHMDILPLDLSPYKLILINPGIHISTAWAFSKITPSSARPSLKELINSPVRKWKDNLYNDFEFPVFNEYPQIKSIKELLYNKGAVYASLSGSGSTVYGLFENHPVHLPEFPQHYFVKVLGF